VNRFQAGKRGPEPKDCHYWLRKPFHFAFASAICSSAAAPPFITLYVWNNLTMHLCRKRKTFSLPGIETLANHSIYTGYQEKNCNSQMMKALYTTSRVDVLPPIALHRKGKGRNKDPKEEDSSLSIEEHLAYQSGFRDSPWKINGKRVPRVAVISRYHPPYLVLSNPEEPSRDPDFSSPDSDDSSID
jgi:hypothetical protein